MDQEEQTAGAPPGAAGPAFVKALEDLLITLRRSSKDLAFYPQGHPQLSRSLERALEELHAAVGTRGPLQLTVSRTGFGFEGRPVGHENRQLASMAAELFVRRIQQIFFAQGVEPGELSAFLRVITSDPKQLVQQGGPGKVLAAHGVARIQVNEFDFRRVGGAAAAAARGTGSASAGAPSDVAQSAQARGARGRAGSLQGPGGAGPTAEGEQREGTGSLEAAEAEEGARPAAAEEFLASLGSRKGQTEQTVEALIQRLEHEATSGGLAGYEWAASRLEAAAGQAVGDDRLEEVLAILRVFLQHQQTDSLQPNVRERAAQAVETIAAGNGVEYLVEHLGVDAGVSVEDLSVVLAGLGPRAIPPLLERLARADQGAAREHLVATLGRLCQVAQPDVTRALQGLEGDRACQLAPVLGRAGGDIGLALLTGLFRHRNPRVRGEVIRELGRFGEPAAQRLLMQALRDPDPTVLELAVGFVGAAKLRLAAPTLLRLAGQRAMTGQPFAVRKAAVTALGAMGDPGFISILIELLHTRTWFKRAAGDELRQTAALALLAMARPEARQVVEAGARSRRGDVRRACDAALRKVATATPGQG